VGSIEGLGGGLIYKDEERDPGRAFWKEGNRGMSIVNWKGITKKRRGNSPKRVAGIVGSLRKNKT